MQTATGELFFSVHGTIDADVTEQSHSTSLHWDFTDKLICSDGTSAAEVSDSQKGRRRVFRNCSPQLSAGVAET